MSNSNEINHIMVGLITGAIIATVFMSWMVLSLFTHDMNITKGHRFVVGDHVYQCSPVMKIGPQ